MQLVPIAPIAPNPAILANEGGPLKIREGCNMSCEISNFVFSALRHPSNSENVFTLGIRESYRTEQQPDVVNSDYLSIIRTLSSLQIHTNAVVAPGPNTAHPTVILAARHILVYMVL
jgi:hypothetical protein